MRAGMSPLDNLSPFEVLTKNTIGNNIGNMLFPYSISRTLTKEDTEISTIVVEKSGSKKQIDYFNQEYDCLVLPFANAFRKSFIPNLKATANFVDKMKIPCSVVGIGMQKELGKDTKNPDLDDATKKFMKAVLKKSAIVGVRGEETGQYLKELGFIEEKEFTVIGCPSMYTFGKELPKPQLTELTTESSLSFNSKISLPQKFHDFIHRSMMEYKNYNYVPQVIEEIYRMYAGMPYPEKFYKGMPQYFPVKYSNAIYKSGKGLSFVNVPSWLEYLKNKDLSVGSRIHGNIAAILAGTPCFIVVSDKRILELVSYHQIPHILMEELNEKTNIRDLYEKADYSNLHKGHEARFMHYLDFLNQNGLETIYDKNGNVKSVPFDKKVAAIDYEAPLRAVSSLNLNQQALRIEQFMGYYRNRVLELERDKRSLRNKIKKYTSLSKE